MNLNEDPVFNSTWVKNQDKLIDHSIKEIRRIPKPTKKKKDKDDFNLDDMNLEDLKNMDFSKFNYTDDKLKEMMDRLNKMKEKIGEFDIPDLKDAKKEDN